MSNPYFWNHLDLPTPVILSSKVRCHNSVKVVADLKSLMNVVKKTIDGLKQLDLEAATLSRLIYRAKHKLRQEKGFKALQKINRCLTNYLTMHLPFVFSSIRDTLHGDVGPTRQMVEWALVRLLGVAHLFNRVYHLCVDAAGHLYVKIKLAHLLELTFFSIATVSRIWTFSQFLVRHACEWYQSLRQFLEVLEPSPVPWLPEGCVLPLDAIKTLKNPQYLKLKYVQKPNKMLSQLKVPLSDSDKKELTRNLSAVIDNDDFGELMPRDVPEKNCDKLRQNIEIVSPPQESLLSTREDEKTQEINKSIKKYKHSVDNIQSSNDLVKFFQVECTLRKMTATGSKTMIQHQCVLGHVDKLQWLIIKKFIKKQIIAIKRTEHDSSNKNQEKLLKHVRENILKWVS